jgi:hypothetical protein
MDQCGAHADSAEDPGHGIGFTDVSDDFGGVDKVVDRDEIEADAKLLPEHPFGRRAKEQEEADEKHRDVRQRCAPRCA